MTARDRGETDAIVRRLRGYARVFQDPPRGGDPARIVRERMELLMCEGFLALDKRLRSGEPIPEVWDFRMGHMYRVRTTGADYRYTYPPGRDALDSCTRCDWIDRQARESACRRCHVIRMRVMGE